MAGVRLLHGVDRQEADGVDGSLVEALWGHGRLPCYVSVQSRTRNRSTSARAWMASRE
jgi:hypothetical protein